jgi:hypothetical protein
MKLPVAIMVVGAAAPALARDLYVSPAGNDAGTGGKDAPLRTIARAARVAAAGDTVHVAPGEYRDAIVDTANGTADARIVFVSDVRWAAKIVATANQVGWDVRGSYVDVIGFDVAGAQHCGICVAGSFARTIGNHVHDMPDTGCGSNGGAGIDDYNYDAHDDDMIGNVVHDIGPATECHAVHGLYHSNLRGKIVNNIAYRNSGWGIHTWHNPKDVLIANNLVFENRSGGIVIGAGDNPVTGVADGFLVENNIAVKNGNWGIVEEGRLGPNNRYVSNLLWGNSRGPIALGTGKKDVGTVLVDPLFVKYDGAGNAGDYHLQPGSPAIDRGAAEMAPADDIDGATRPQGKAIDIGPYEFGGRASADGGLPDATGAADARPSVAADGPAPAPRADATGMAAPAPAQDAARGVAGGGPGAGTAGDAAPEPPAAPARGAARSGGCGCALGAAARAPAVPLALLGLLSLRRRRCR